ncbi:MAG TPA: RNA polymerase sigma-70 factor [Chitinophagaceae bacterium]|nr:RNA polymerase sigma-70 factor [Chitinophagaceae bacterium]HAN38897.1 RNA polymerase sigma-70 factor [Chitinophagaceae bacterium]
MADYAHMYDDAYCLIKIKEGEEFYFNLIFEKYRDQLFSYLYKVSKSKEIAEEIVLDVFLKLWHGREAITEIQKLESFLYTVAYNKAIDFFRAAKRSPLLQQAVWDVLSDVATTDSADAHLRERNLEILIREAIGQLSPQRRKVFELRQEHGLSYAEIAQTLNLSTNTVRNHLAASVEFIKEHLRKNNALLLLPVSFFDKFL